jgi:succinate dehydrogenase/fumarate reductase-like Fe-S protein
VITPSYRNSCRTPQTQINFCSSRIVSNAGSYSACPTVATDTKFLGPQALAQAYRYSADARDAGSRYGLTSIDSRHGLWRCHFSGSCKVCPKGVDPALGIQLLRGNIMSIAKRRRLTGDYKITASWEVCCRLLVCLLHLP